MFKTSVNSKLVSRKGAKVKEISVGTLLTTNLFFHKYSMLFIKEERNGFQCLIEKLHVLPQTVVLLILNCLFFKGRWKANLKTQIDVIEQ